MGIKNQAQLEVELENLFRTGTALPKPTDIKQYLRDALESSRSYAVAAWGGADTFSITSTPTKFNHFSMDVAIDGASLVKSDAANQKLVVTKPAHYALTLIMNAKWSTGEDLTIEVRIDGAANFYNPVEFHVEGKGTNDPELIAVSGVAFPIGSLLVAGNGDSVDVEVYLSSTTGNFTLNQENFTMGLTYSPFTIHAL
jgi:hypothetical protein